MGYKIIPHTFRDDSSVSAERVLENMRAIASEVNGNLDRENIPKDGITTAMIKPEAFNTIVHNVGSTSFSIGSGGWQEVDAPNMSINTSLNEDSVLIVHYGCTYEWAMKVGGLRPYATSNVIADAAEVNWNADLSWLGTANVFSTNVYLMTKETYCDFELRVNGNVVAKSEFNNVFRKKFHISMNGAIEVPGGEVSVSVHAKLFRKDGIQTEDVSSFTLNVADRSIVAEFKKR